MAEKFIAPRLGEGVEELYIVNWIKKEGDNVEELEPIVEVETDKVVTELPSPSSGKILKILVKEDNPIRVGEVLAIIGQADETNIDESDQIESVEHIKETQDNFSQKEVEEESQVVEKQDAKNQFISPLVRKIAAENQVALEQVQGSGLGGRITKDDILTYIQKRKVIKPNSDIKTRRIEQDIELSNGSLLPHTSLRRQIAERMVHSVQTSPHVLTVMEADLSAVIRHRTENKPVFAEKGINLTLTAYFISAIVQGLKTYPEVNASWMDEGLFIHTDINIGMAVALGSNGLIVPVIKNADNLSLQGIATQVNDLAERARNKKLLPDEVKDGTFTLTNHGTGKSLFASPIIFQPQTGILGTGALQKRAVVVTDNHGNDSIAIRPMIYLSFVFDHRILDGEGADNFLAKVKESLENW
jgi:2-oxoglutarate dehydrogenase E2 component (dihydrolipoamide succinyltransferase)